METWLLIATGAAIIVVNAVLFTTTKRPEAPTRPRPSGQLVAPGQRRPLAGKAAPQPGTSDWAVSSADASSRCRRARRLIRPAVRGCPIENDLRPALRVRRGPSTQHVSPWRGFRNA